MKSVLTLFRMTVRHPIAATRFGRLSARFLRDYIAFIRRMARQKQPFDLTGLNPRLDDRQRHREGHYFHQDLYVAQRIFLNNPVKHVDVGSRLDGFVTHVASFREIEVVDIRDPGVNIPNVRFLKADMISDDFDLRDYCDSASSLHVIEHLGLGRYGDPIDPDGHLKGLNNIYRMLKAGGRFYFSVPIGPQRVEFNAHRVFSVSYLTALLRDRYEIENFCYENDTGQFFQNVDLAHPDAGNNFGCRCGCGLFVLRKK